MTEIPIQFNEVNGSFYCDDNQLTSLEGSPKIVEGHFDCANNQNLKSIDYLPESWKEIRKLTVPEHLESDLRYLKWKLYRKINEK